MNMKLELAKTLAEWIVRNLQPHCDRLPNGQAGIEIAGSIRRERPEVNDIDIVAIPLHTSKWSMFSPGKVLETDFADAFRDLVRLETSGEKIMRGTTRPGLAGEMTPPISVDIYMATPESWATLLLIRTGSAEHNIWMCSRAKACGGKLHADGSGLEVPGQYDQIQQRVVNSRIIRAASEEEIFKAMGIAYAEPRDRECPPGRGKPVWMRGATA